MSRNLSTYFIISIIWLLALPLKAQQFKVNHYRQDNGLPTNITKGIAQDSLGFIWVASDLGLARFDGQNFHQVNDGIPSQYAKSLSMLPNGSLVAITDGGAVQITSAPDTAWLAPFPSDTTIANFNFPKEVYTDCNGYHWVSEDVTVMRWKGSQHKRYQPKGSEHGGSFWRSTLMWEQNCQMMTASMAGFISYFDTSIDSFIPLSHNRSVPLHLPESLYGWNFNTAAPLSNHYVLIGSSKGLLLFDIDFDTKQATLIRHILKDTHIQHVHLAADGTIYAGTMGQGLFAMNGPFATPSLIEGLPFSVVNYIFEDREGNLWLSGDVGVALLQPRLFTAVANPAGLPLLPVGGEDQHMYALTAEGMAYELQLNEQGEIKAQELFKNPLIKRVTLPNTLPQPAQVSVQNGEVLIANEASSSFWSINTQGGKEIPTPLTHAPMMAKHDASGGLWAVSGHGEVAHWKQGMEQAKVYKFNPDRFMTIATVADGSVYALQRYTDNYLYQYNAQVDSFENISIPLTLLDDDGHNDFLAFDVAKDQEGALWLGANFGLFRIKDGKAQQIDLGKGYNRYIKAVSIDNQGGIWMATNTALIYYNDGEPRIFTEGTGLPTSNIQFDGLTITEDSTLWVMTYRGLAYARPQAYAGKSTPSPTILHLSTSQNTYKFANKAIQAIKVDHNDYLKISFASLSFPGSHIRYRYRVIGLDKQWQTPEGQAQIILTDIPSGTYQLEIQARQEGVYRWSDSSSFSFSVIPAWYTTWWGILSIIAALGLLAFASARTYGYRLRKQRMHLQHLVEERTAEIALKNSKLQSQHDELKQLNEVVNQTNEELQTTIEVINEQKDEIEKKNRDITASINYASRIQAAAFPEDKQLSLLFDDYFVLFRPRDIVSGDFYWCGEVNGKTIVAVADCTGHGVPGAMMSMIGDAMLNQTINEQNIDQPSQILLALDTGIRKMLHQEYQGDNYAYDGMDIGICVIDKAQGTLHYAGAKTPIIYFQDGISHRIKGDRYSIGGYRENPSFTDHQIKIGQGLHAYLFSDGIKDQFGGPHGKKLMAKNFLSMLNQIQGNPCPQQGALLEKQLDEWMTGYMHIYKQIDDILVFGFKV